MKRGSKYVPVQNFKCKKCGEVRLSLFTHDFQKCACGNYIDGGFAYGRVGGKFEDMETLPLYWKKGEIR